MKPLLNKLSTQIGLFFFIGSTLVLGAFAWVNYINDTKEIPLRLETEAVMSTHLVTSSINSDVLYRRPFPLWKQMKQTQKRFEQDGQMLLSEFAVLDVDRMVLTHSDPYNHPIMKRMDMPAHGVYRNGHTIQVVDKVLHRQDSRIIGHVILKFDAVQMEREFAELKEHIYIAIITSLIFALAFAIAVSYRISAPLKLLTSLASRIGDGDIEVDGFSRKPTDIKSLAGAIHDADQTIKVKTEELAGSQALLKDILNHSPAVIYIKDLAGKYLLVNSRYEELFNVTTSFMVGKTDGDIFDSALADELRANDEDVINGGLPVIMEEMVPDERGPRHYYSLKFPLFDSERKMYALCGISTDVTDQKESERELSKLATVVEQADEMVIITNKDGIIEYVNKAFEKISGYSSEYAIGKTPGIVTSGHHSDTYYSAMWKTLMAGEVWQGDFINKRKDGTLYEVVQSTYPLIDDKGGITGFSSVQRDVTEQRQIRQKLQHTDRVESLGILAGGIAHDFNNLLTAILGNTILASKALHDHSPAIKYIQKIEDASH